MTLPEESEPLILTTRNTYDSTKNGGLSKSPAPEKFVYSWSNITAYTKNETSLIRRLWPMYKTKQPKQILNDVSGVAYSGEVLAIMGASGGGKTTLLNALTFKTNRNIRVSGKRALNGVPVDLNSLTSISAYIQQEDLFIGTLTVREHLRFQALVRMDKSIPYASRMQRVDEVMSELSLQKCANTIIGCAGRIKGISGGEMKRLSFASEVLTNPMIMFCDEPTSGLDSFMAQNVVSVLKQLAAKGKTIVVTIHQPSSEVYAMFDRILLMTEGKLAFLGTRDQANDFFSSLGAPCPTNHNPADYFIQLLAVVPTREETCRNMINMICDSYKQSNVGTKVLSEAVENTKTDIKTSGLGKYKWFSSKGTSPYKASWCAQFKALLWRSWLSVIKEPNLVKAKMLQTLMVALLIGILYFGQENDQDGVMNLNGAMFAGLINMSFQNMFAVINIFCEELQVFLRERLNGMYRSEIYFLAKTIAETPVFLVVPVLFSSVVYFMIGLNPTFLRFLKHILVMIMVSNVATSFGYMVSCMSSSISVALSVGPPIVIPFLLFGGFFLNTASIPPYLVWLSWFSWFKYANEGVLITQWDGVDEIACTRSNATCPPNGMVVLETLSVNVNHYWVDVVALLALIIGFRMLALMGILIRVHRNQNH